MTVSHLEDGHLDESDIQVGSDDGQQLDWCDSSHSQPPSKTRSNLRNNVLGVAIDALFPAVLLAVGLGLLFIPSWSPTEVLTERAQGTVTSLGDLSCKAEGGDQINWLHTDGAMTVTADIKGERYSAELDDDKLCYVHEVGSTVEVWYDPNNPKDFGLSHTTATGRYWLSAILIVPGSIGVIVPYFFLIAGMLPIKPKSPRTA